MSRSGRGCSIPTSTSTARWTRARSSTRRWTRSPGGIPDDIRADYLACYDGDRYVESMRYVRRYPEELPELAELLPRITTPVTIINGRNDRVVRSPTPSSSHERLPNSRLAIIDAGHFVWEEAPAEYASIILDVDRRSCVRERDHTTSHRHCRDAVRRSAGVEFAYRRFGRDAAELPLMLLQHFRGNLDNWDPALTDALAAEREVILVDYPGVGASTGDAEQLDRREARQMIAFVGALGLERIDLLGFSIGGFVAQEIALVRPTLVRRLVLAATGPKGAPGHARLARGHRRRRARREQAREPPLHHVRPHRDQPGEGRRVPRPLPAAPGRTATRRQRRRPRRPVRRDRRVGHPRPRRAAAADAASRARRWSSRATTT